jgi:outer membrane immunogenic protein
MFMNIRTKHFELGGIPVKKLLTSVSFIVLSSATVLAADLPMKAAPMMAPAPVFSWTGCYIGGHVGAGTMRDSNTTDGSVVSGLELSLLGGGNNGTGTGAIAGGQVGCNYQDGNFVFGLEGEGYWSGIKTTTGFSLPNEVTVTETAKNKNDFSIAARAGIAFDRTFVYGKAGWVWGAFDFGFNEAVNGDGITVLSVAQSGNLNGLLLGVGVEHALTPKLDRQIGIQFFELRFEVLELDRVRGGGLRTIRFLLPACVQADLQGGRQLPVQLGCSAAGCEVLIFVSSLQPSKPRHRPGLFCLRPQPSACAVSQSKRPTRIAGDRGWPSFLTACEGISAVGRKAYWRQALEPVCQRALTTSC